LDVSTFEHLDSSHCVTTSAIQSTNLSLPHYTKLSFTQHSAQLHTTTIAAAAAAAAVVVVVVVVAVVV